MAATVLPIPPPSSVPAPSPPASVVAVCAPAAVAAASTPSATAAGIDSDQIDIDQAVAPRRAGVDPWLRRGQCVRCGRVGWAQMPPRRWPPSEHGPR